VKAMAALSTLVFAAFAVTGCRGPTGPKPLVFTDVTVIDATGVPQKAGMMVVVVGDRITRIEKYERNRVPSGADVVNGEGKCFGSRSVGHACSLVSRAVFTPLHR
jgi:hypothetical protein